MGNLVWSVFFLLGKQSILKFENSEVGKVKILPTHPLISPPRMLEEMKLSSDEAAIIWGSGVKGWKGFFSRSLGASGGLGLLWKERDVKVDLVAQNFHWQLVSVSLCHSHLSFFLFNIYAPFSIQGKKIIWLSLQKDISDIGDNLFLLGVISMPFPLTGIRKE
ncbi:hypothetical protein KI387_030158, partial [Taxus chinensis]